MQLLSGVLVFVIVLALCMGWCVLLIGRFGNGVAHDDGEGMVDWWNTSFVEWLKSPDPISQWEISKANEHKVDLPASEFGLPRNKFDDESIS